ncbi:hypothetical protein Tco_1274733 [Tanacetum coccineum]
MANNQTECSPSKVCLSDSDSELLIPTTLFDESKNGKMAKSINAFDLDKGTESIKEKVSQEHVCEEEVPLNNNIGKQSDDLVKTSSEAFEQGMDDHVLDKIDGAKCEQLPNHVVKKVTLNF